MGRAFSQAQHVPAGAPATVTGVDLCLLPVTGAPRLQLAAPPETELRLREVALTASADAAVPVRFVPRAPGELTVSGGGIVYDCDAGAPRRPAPPAGGLAEPTPPGRTPGTEDDGACPRCGGPCASRNGGRACTRCGARVETQPRPDVVRRAGPRPVLGTVGVRTIPSLLRRVVSGELVATGRLRPVPEPRPAVPPAEPVPARPTEPPPADPAPVRPAQPTPAVVPLAPGMISGLAERRIARLVGAGIDSLAGLAAASPRQVAATLAVSPAQATRFIEAARGRPDGSVGDRPGGEQA